MNMRQTADWLPFTIGTLVVLKCGDGEDRGMVNGVLLIPGGEQYFIGWSDGSKSFHWEHELSEAPEFT